MTMRPLYLFTCWLAWSGALVLSARAEATKPATTKAEIVEVKKIWDRGGHNAFTDLIRWHDRWWCTFRESEAHVGGDGIIRILTSTDGATWDSVAGLAEKDVDLRDPKLSVMPDDRLMLVCGGSIYLGTKQLKGRRPRVSFSKDGREWSVPQKILSEGDWLWRVTWHDGVAYGVSYRSGATAATSAGGGEWDLILFKSRDGVTWSEHAKLAVPGRPNETTLRVMADGRMVAMVRRESGDQLGWFGEAKAPFTEWTWHSSNGRWGGPDLLELPDGRVIAGTRLYPTATADGAKGKVAMILAKVENHRLETLVTLPSGGDTSYPRLVWYEGLLWVSYYSSHEGKTSIYLAKVKL